MSYKQVIVVRRDLKMRIGEIATQVAHAAILSAEKSRRNDFATFSRWLGSGQAKVVLKVHSHKELLVLRQAAENFSLLVVTVEDLRPSQNTTGTWTCICIGPAQSIFIDKVTSNLKLL